jgi:hypothetical protein
MEEDLRGASTVEETGEGKHLFFASRQVRTPQRGDGDEEMERRKKESGQDKVH